MNRSRFLSDILSTIFERRYSASAAEDKRPIEEVCRSLLTGAGEVSGLKLARTIIARYGAMDPQEKEAFFRFLTEELDVDTDAVEASARLYGSERTPEHLEALIGTAEPVRQELLRRINQVPGATAQLVAMRLDLLGFLKDNPAFGRTDLDFIHLFTSWFNRGFLVLRRIDWDTPANILEKIIEYEAVHAIDDWHDLRRRIEPEDRHCFAFFHPVMPDEPLIFVEVALAKGVPGSVQEVLAEEREILSESQADTAVFYSISNCQRGLRGISFGNSLIKQVVEDLSRDLPHLKTFVTLSPVPGLNRWLQGLKEERPDGAVSEILSAVEHAERSGDTDSLDHFAPEMRYLATQYLVEQKRPNGLPLDPVARFHLGNGALVHDVHALADISPNGLRQSSGVMVNYLYDLSKVEQNHEEFATNQTVAQSRTIQSILRAGFPDRKTRKTANG
ncbi:malonyl-CoA decarboxylase [Nitratireductor sp. XY-223]|uniref:malonyl-CoA decarboxylase n=1 Tax=Nitratireductor sp. XY-223 TaxID=2561926 RepID=UPI0010AAC067|nr:malonyl-CoA decarboxylase [Nitratireductor sp. XY-223]